MVPSNWINIYETLKMEKLTQLIEISILIS